MSGLDELAFHDATALAALVRRGEVTALELLDATIARIDRLNPALNAVVTPMYEEARRIAKGELAGPFAGVPFLLKDLQAFYRGVRLTGASAFLEAFVPGHDSELVVRLKRAGLVIAGKTNLPEFGILPTTEPRLFGPTRNPWAPDRTPGGSSGGAAAAVAAGLVPFAHANDGGGSIRIPASCCGLFGLKPTRARNPLGPDFGDVISGLVVEHAVTRSVRDSAALLDVTAGPDLGDPYWAPPAARAFVRELRTAPGRLRIAYTTATANGAVVHPDCRAAVEDAVRLATDLGHEVEEAAPTIDGPAATATFITLWASGYAWIIDGMASLVGRPPADAELEPFTQALYRMGAENTASTYLRALHEQQRFAREIARFFTTYDVWLTPTLAEPPIPTGTVHGRSDDPLAMLLRAGQFAPYTPLCNMTGQPAMSVPLFWNAEGLPIGTHWVGRFGDEATLFRLAAQLEAARPWADRRPPLAVGTSAPPA